MPFSLESLLLSSPFNFLDQARHFDLLVVIDRKSTSANGQHKNTLDSSSVAQDLPLLYSTLEEA
jgi:hypothetical protein